MTINTDLARSELSLGAPLASRTQDDSINKIPSLVLPPLVLVQSCITPLYRPQELEGGMPTRHRDGFSRPPSRGASLNYSFGRKMDWLLVCSRPRRRQTYSKGRLTHSLTHSERWFLYRQFSSTGKRVVRIRVGSLGGRITAWIEFESDVEIALTATRELASTSTISRSSHSFKVCKSTQNSTDFSKENISEQASFSGAQNCRAAS